jgi:sensor histidine kinase regulating citrate/malate metabolism
MIMSKLFKKTLLIIIVLFGVIAVTLAVSSGWNLYRDLTKEYKSKGTAIAKSIADSSVETLLNRDASTVQAMIDQFLEISGV